MRECKIPVQVPEFSADLDPTPVFAGRYEIAVPHLRDISFKRGEINAIFVKGNHHIGVTAHWDRKQRPPQAITA
jgi:hypothetical protein